MPPTRLKMRVLTTLHRTAFDVSHGRWFSEVHGMAVVKLTTVGRRSGKVRHTMLAAPLHDDATVTVVASNGGAPRHPGWYLNVREQPEVTVSFGGRSRSMVARSATASERDALWSQIVVVYRGYAAYQIRTDREIPVVVLEDPSCVLRSGDDQREL